MTTNAAAAALAGSVMTARTRDVRTTSCSVTALKIIGNSRGRHQETSARGQNCGLPDKALLLVERRRVDRIALHETASRCPERRRGPPCPGYRTTRTPARS